MKLSDRMRKVFKKGVAASKDLAKDIGTKASDLGNKGVIKIESAELKSRENGLMEKLGGEAYAALVTRDKASLKRDDHAIRALLDGITDLRARIAAMESEYRAIGVASTTSVKMGHTPS
jgi:hypothetical protein